MREFRNSAASRQDLRREILFGGETRTFLVHLPPSYDSSRPTPLVLAFHGGGGQASGMRHLVTGGLSDEADRRGFVAVYPQGLHNHWNDGRQTLPDRTDDVGFVSALIDRLSADFAIDASRIYATGISNGGMFAQRLACELPGRIAAVASVASTMAADYFPHCAPSRPIPVLMIHGTEDPFFPFAGGQLRRQGRTGYGGTVISVPEAVAFWASRDQAAARPVRTELPDTDPADGTRIFREAYEHGRNGTEVVLYRIEGGGHTWPGGVQYLPEAILGKTSRDINGNTIIWEFFSRHRLTSPSPGSDRASAASTM